MAQLVKNPPAMWETWVQFLGWEEPLEKGKATHSSILVWRIPMDCIVHGSHKDLDMTEQLSPYFHIWLSVFSASGWNTVEQCLQNANRKSFGM